MDKLRNVYATLLFIFMIAMLVFGLIIVYSAVQNNEDYNYSRQLIGVVVGVILMLVFWRFDYKYFSEAIVVLIIVNVVLILSPHIPGLGVTVKGASS